MEAFGDIILLDMPENMNSGKTHAFFSWAAENASVYPGQRPDYVVKADDDSFIMLGELEHRLRLAPRQKSIWGCEWCRAPAPALAKKVPSPR
jgi:hypothetical protein